MNSNEKIMQPYDEYSFGKYIHHRRKELGYSLRALANKLQISAVYLSDLESGNRKAPITTRSSINYMDALITHLELNDDEIIEFHKMAIATRDLYPELHDYLKENKLAPSALYLAKEVNLSDENWQKIISIILESKQENI